MVENTRRLELQGFCKPNQPIGNPGMRGETSRKTEQTKFPFPFPFPSLYHRPDDTQNLHQMSQIQSRNAFGSRPEQANHDRKMRPWQRATLTSGLSTRHSPTVSSTRKLLRFPLDKLDSVLAAICSQHIRRRTMLE